MKSLKMIVPAAFLTLSACVITTTQSGTGPAPVGPWPEDVKIELFKACAEVLLEDGYSNSFVSDMCSCQVNSFEQNVPLSTFANDLENGSLQKEPYLSIINRCAELSS